MLIHMIVGVCLINKDSEKSKSVMILAKMFEFVHDRPWIHVPVMSFSRLLVMAVLVDPVEFALATYRQNTAVAAGGREIVTKLIIVCPPFTVACAALALN